MLIIEKNDINKFLEELAEKMPVIIPSRREKFGAVESVFEKFEIGSPVGGIDFDYLPTLRSIKEFFLPAEEETFSIENKRGKVSVSPAPKPFVVFGLNERDLEALKQLDEIMARPNSDFFYFQKRNEAIIIGLVNEPIKIIPKGDLILLKINDGQYEALAATEKGKSLAKNKLFKDEPAVVIGPGPKSQNQIMPRLRNLLISPELLADAVKWSWKNDPAVWEELATRCLGCGICTYVCPLCSCFFLEDGVSLDKKTCSRCRSWDSCTLPRFAQITGGFNFHKTIKERYYNWYFHKFVRAYREYGKAQCVACGRCQKYCPAKIDIEEYLLRIINNYKKAMGL